jgi:formyl-CoA transferase
LPTTEIVGHHLCMQSSAGPLTGIRVVELGNFIAGPFAGQLLGDWGADVVKVESPGDGDPMRHWGVTTDDGDSLWWPTIARNKRSVTADMRTDEGRSFVRALLDSADIAIENFRPGRMDEWGLDYESLSTTNPGLILVHVSGYGQTGPRAAEAGFGSIGEAMGGVRYTTGDPDRPPARCGISLGDSLAAVHAVMGALAALHERHDSGKGQEVDVAIYEAVASLMESTMADFTVGGVTRQRSGGTLPGVAPANAYPTADGSEILIAGNADGVFRRLCTAMGRPELADDPRYVDHGSRGANSVELDALVADWTRTADADDLLTLLADSGVPAGRVYTAPDMVTDEHYAARDMVLHRTSRAGFDLPMTGIVPRFSRTPGSVRDVGPELGEHDTAVRAELSRD